jgi:putative FmdB family regulatory protein
MPIFEYACRACRHRFEALVLRPDQEAAACPECRSGDLEKLISTFAADSDGTRRQSLSAARRSNARVTRDKAWADYEYDRKHRHE